MAIKVKMLSDRRNLNSMRVTAAFIEQVVANRQRYIGTPLMVDKLRLESGQYNRLTHLQDERTGAFCSQQIGSFVNFEIMKEADGEIVLVGIARIEKRFERACTAVQELYEMGKLCVSFEITASVYEQREDELIIDAADENNLIGMCIVSIPAYEDARALALVASMMTSANEVITERKLSTEVENEKIIKCWKRFNEALEREEAAEQAFNSANRLGIREEVIDYIEELRKIESEMKSSYDSMRMLKMLAHGT